MKCRTALRTEPWDPPEGGQGDAEPAKETEKERPVRRDSQEGSVLESQSQEGRKVC